MVFLQQKLPSGESSSSNRADKNPSPKCILSLAKVQVHRAEVFSDQEIHPQKEIKLAFWGGFLLVNVKKLHRFLFEGSQTR